MPTRYDPNRTIATHTHVVQQVGLNTVVHDFSGTIIFLINVVKTVQCGHPNLVVKPDVKLHHVVRTPEIRVKVISTEHIDLITVVSAYAIFRSIPHITLTVTSHMMQIGRRQETLRRKPLHHHFLR